MQETIEKLDKVLHGLARGLLSIDAAEKEMDSLCCDNAVQFSDINERLARYKRLKRYCWRHLLQITK